MELITSKKTQARKFLLFFFKFGNNCFKGVLYPIIPCLYLLSSTVQLIHLNQFSDSWVVLERTAAEMSEIF